MKLLPEPTEESSDPPTFTHPPTYRWESDGAVDLLRTTVSPHSLFTRRPTGGNPTARSTF